MREVNTHGTAGGGVWLGPSICVSAISTRYRRGLNRQRSGVEKLAKVTPGCVRDADRQTDLHLPKKRLSLQTENLFFSQVLDCWTFFFQLVLALLSEARSGGEPCTWY